MAGNNEGNKITQNTLSRAVNREKKKSKNGQYKQTKQKVDHSTPIPTLPYPKISYQAVNTNIGPISKPSRVTPPRNQNINNSHSSTTKKNGRIKTTILTMVLIQPRPLSGKTHLRFNAKFDTLEQRHSCRKMSTIVSVQWASSPTPDQ